MKSFVETLSENIAIRSGFADLDHPQIISSSYGNDSVALIQWVSEAGYRNVQVVFIDTKWAADGWMDRVERCEKWVASLGFTPRRLNPPVGFEELIISRGGFPNQRYQWCSGHLKGVPFLEWADEVDPECRAVVMIGKRRSESRERASTPEWIIGSEYHGGRVLRHPLFKLDDSARDILIERAGFEVLPHRSQECAPCVNANRGDMLLLGPNEIGRVLDLEFETGHTMFRPKRHMGAKGILEVIKWANAPRGKYAKDESPEFTCSSGYCGF